MDIFTLTDHTGVVIATVDRAAALARARAMVEARAIVQPIPTPHLVVQVWRDGVADWREGIHVYAGQ